MSYQLAAKKTVTISAFVLFSLIFLGIIFASTSDIALSATNQDLDHLTWLIVAYVAGLSMIVLPCTLPLVFIIVPLSMGKGYKKGFLMASLFGAGLIITITAYGLGIASFGKVAGLDQVSFVMFLVAGVAAFLFGLAQLNLIQLKFPSYSGMPKFIQKRSEYSKTFFMGLLLGNAGVGCPNPLFYWLLIHIASVGSLEIGASLGLVHGVGRAIPLIFMATLAILGINAIKNLKSKRFQIEKASGWMLIIIGAFLIINGIPGGHQWYEQTLIHILWNNVVSMTPIPAEYHIGMHTHEAQPGTNLAEYYAPIILAAMILGPILWYLIKKKNEIILPRKRFRY